MDVPVQYFQSVIAIGIGRQRRPSVADPLLRVERNSDAATNERDPDYAVTVVGLLLYVVVVAGVLVLLDIE
jgi:hypothetical protein